MNRATNLILPFSWLARKTITFSSGNTTNQKITGEYDHWEESDYRANCINLHESRWFMNSVSSYPKLDPEAIGNCFGNTTPAKIISGYDYSEETENQSNSCRSVQAKSILILCS